jgi:2-haloacid dehalogenase
LFSCFGKSYSGAFTVVQLVAVGKSLDGIFEAVLLIEAVGIYKPHPRVCQLALDRFAVPAAAIRLQSSRRDPRHARRLVHSYGPGAG